MPLSKRSASFFLTITFIFLCLHSFGQQAQDHFGKNRIQYKQFQWQYISTYNFEIYYYSGGKELAQAVANYAESGFHRIVDQTGFTPYSKIKILVYNTTFELQQSNIGLDFGNGLMGGGLVGGQTQFVKSKMEVSFKGSQTQLKRDVEFLLAEMFINIMLYGGSLKDIVQSAYLLSLPDWYVNGAAAYIAEGWSQEMDNYMRDKVLKGNFKKPTILTGRDATITGQSIWNYIAERYGKHSVANILNLTRVVRNEEAGIESSLGIPYSIFMKDWRNFYLEATAPLTVSYEDLPESDRIIKSKKHTSIRNLKISPDGKRVSYIRDNHGKYSLVIFDVESKKKKIIHRGGHNLINQAEDPNVIIHSWKDSDIIAFIENKFGQLFLTFIDLKTNKKERKKLEDFNQITSFSFSSDGKKMILSGDKTGQTDLFIYHISNNSFQQLTNDLYDDLSPTFVDNYSIAFCSNRLNDTLKSAPVPFKNIQPLFNIFIIDMNPASNNILKRITDFGNNYNPISLNSNEIIYISNEKGIKNIYKYSLIANESVQLTSYIRDIKNFDLSSNKSLVYLARCKGKENIYYQNNFDLNPIIVHDLSLTQREKIFEEEHPRKNRYKKIISDSTSEEQEININDYQFESDIKKKNKKSTIYFSSGSHALRKDEIKYKGPYPYLGTFGIDRVNSTFMIDPLRGTGILLEADMGDMMGNHRMNGGIFLLTNLKSSSIFGEYLYLKKKVDFKLRYDRKVIYYANDISVHEYTLNKFAATASYPLSSSSRISASPFITTTRFTDLSSSPTAFNNRDVTTLYTGIQGQYVFDNTIVTGLNMLEGTRGKITIEQYLDPTNNVKNFGKFVIDFRHYHSLHKNLIFATRASYGQFFGNSPKRFLLGGMDNWLFNSTNHPSNDPLALTPFTENSNLLFVEYVTNMRGFNYNSQNGAKYVLFNAELRWPIVSYFYNGVINSNFLKNLQFVGFTDIGASWTGKNPFSTDNSTNTTVISGGSSPFSAKVINYKNPFLIGYGVGVRTLFLGYYVKGDFAWGMEDNKVVNKKFYLTIGFDF